MFYSLGLHMSCGEDCFWPSRMLGHSFDPGLRLFALKAQIS